MSEYLSPGVYVKEVPSAVQPIAGVGTSTAGFIGMVPDTIKIPATNPKYDPTKDTDLSTNPPTNPPYVSSDFTLPDKAGEVRLCTSFGEFKRAFGDFSTDVGQKHLAHAVNGFFHNGGTRCYVVRVEGRDWAPSWMSSPPSTRSRWSVRRVSLMVVQSHRDPLCPDDRRTVSPSSTARRRSGPAST